MNFDEFQQKASEFAIYPKDREREYLSLGLLSEVGELAGKVKKEIRDRVDLTEPILDELGDCAWYTAMICNHLKLSGEEHLRDFLVGNYLSKRLTVVIVRWATGASGLVDAMHEADQIFGYWMNTVIHGIAVIAANRGSSLEAVCARNIAKLTDRKNRDKLGGSGDAR